MIKTYRVLCVFGLVLPYAALALWVIEGGSVGQIWAQVVDNRLSLMAWLDVIVTAIVVIRFIRVDARRERIGGVSAPLAGTCLVGPSFGLPLYLLMREKARAAATE